MTEPIPPTSPPRARLTFRVGIVGHRPNRLPNDETGRQAIRARLAAVLEAVTAAVEAFRSTADAALYAPDPPRLRAISPLARGADQVFAEEALRLGYALCCPMPFARIEFENDFAPAEGQEARSLDRFRGVLDRAAAGAGLTVFELDGSRADEAGAYGAAGRVVLNQSDLLVAVWDGGKPQGGGGTVETLREAIGYRVPVLWIDAKAPYGWALLREEADLDCLKAEISCAPAWNPAVDEQARLAEAVNGVVVAELGLPGVSPETEIAPEARAHAQAYFRERKPSLNPDLVWKLFRNLVGSGRLTLPGWRVRDFVTQIRRAWPTSEADVAAGAAPTAVTAWVNASLRAHYAWSDKLADFYADAHRSTNIVTALFAAAAVFLALLPMAVGWRRGTGAQEAVCITVELAILAIMVALLLARRWRRWHERWLEYRVLAELIRQLRLLIPLGGGRPLPRAPAHLAIYGDPARSWMYWQVRAIARDTGIPAARATPAYASECLDYLLDIADGPDNGQLGFHQESHARSQRIHDRLHAATLMLFSLSILGIGVHIALPALRQAPGGRFIDVEAVGRWLVLISAVAPALGAALASINNQGEFARLAKRSRAMAQGFARFKGQIAMLRDRLTAGGSPPSLAAVTALASQMAEMMVDETIDWRVVVLDLPHVAG